MTKKYTKLVKDGAKIPTFQPVSGDISKKGAPIPAMQPVTPSDSSGSGQGSQDQGSKNSK